METLASVSARHLSQLLALRRPEETTLVVGLGNWNMTPDALGPKVVQKLLITRISLKTACIIPA